MMCMKCRKAGRVLKESADLAHYLHSQCEFKDCTCQHITISMVTRRTDG